MLIKEISSFKTKSPNTLASCFLGCGHLMAIYKVPNYYRVLNYRPDFIIIFEKVMILLATRQIKRKRQKEVRLRVLFGIA